jgi:hypothetical protein
METYEHNILYLIQFCSSLGPLLLVADTGSHDAICAPAIAALTANA